MSRALALALGAAALLGCPPNPPTPPPGPDADAAPSPPTPASADGGSCADACAALERLGCHQRRMCASELAHESGVRRTPSGRAFDCSMVLSLVTIDDAKALGFACTLEAGSP